jgi:hypothetical protein
MATTGGNIELRSDVAEGPGWGEGAAGEGGTLWTALYR